MKPPQIPRDGVDQIERGRKTTVMKVQLKQEIGES